MRCTKGEGVSDAPRRPLHHDRSGGIEWTIESNILSNTWTVKSTAAMLLVVANTYVLLR